MSTILQPDDRWSHFVVRLSDGRFVGWTEELLAQQLDNWASALPVGLPDVVSHHLSQSRSLIQHSWYRYELLPTAAFNAYQAIELHLRELFDSKQPFQKLITRAERQGLLDERSANRLQASRSIRNELVHPSCRILISPADGLSSVRIGHETVAHLTASALLRL